MNKQDFVQALAYLRQFSRPRNFDQSIDLTINFKGIDFKKAENRVEVDVRFPHSTGKQQNIKSVLFAKDKNFAQEAKGIVTRVIMDTEIPSMKKKDVDNLLKDFNVLLAEGPALVVVGKYLGQQLAPKGLMPKLVQHSVSSIEQATRTASTVTKISNKKGKFMPLVHVTIGKESFKDNDIVENAEEAVKAVALALPNREVNLKSVYLKASMGPPIKIGEKYDANSIAAAKAKGKKAEAGDAGKMEAEAGALKGKKAEAGAKGAGKMEAEAKGVGKMNAGAGAGKGRGAEAGEKHSAEKSGKKPEAKEEGGAE